jgi:hypothetical protein
MSFAFSLRDARLGMTPVIRQTSVTFLWMIRLPNLTSRKFNKTKAPMGR